MRCRTRLEKRGPEQPAAEASITPSITPGIAPTGGSAGSVTAEVEDEANWPHLERRQQQREQKAGYDGAFALPAVPLAPDPPRLTLPRRLIIAELLLLEGRQA